MTEQPSAPSGCSVPGLKGRPSSRLQHHRDVIPGGSSEHLANPNQPRVGFAALGEQNPESTAALQPENLWLHFCRETWTRLAEREESQGRWRLPGLCRSACKTWLFCKLRSLRGWTPMSPFAHHSSRFQGKVQGTRGPTPSASETQMSSQISMEIHDKQQDSSSTLTDPTEKVLNSEYSEFYLLTVIFPFSFLTEAKGGV